MKRVSSKVSSDAIVAAFKGTDLTVRTLVDAHIDRVLSMVDGNMSAAAKLLGLDRRSLQRRRSRSTGPARARRRRRVGR